MDDCITKPYRELWGLAVQDAKPAKHSDIPPYRAELFSERTGWAGVMNAQGINCLTFKSKPGSSDYRLRDCKADRRAVEQITTV